jgi:two-component system, chemotaxis family, protein-glutamate methylesterase/glutaminase
MTIRVVVAEDSPTARALLIAVLGGEPDFEVVGECTDGDDAVKLAKRLHPDVMTMDLHMPRMDGLEAIRRIMNEAPTRIVVVSNSIGSHDVRASMEALRAGALTAMPKPCGPGAPEFSEQSRQLTATVRAMSEVKVIRRWASGPSPATPLVACPASFVRKTPGIIVIGASTGGPAALHRLLSDLPARIAVPVVVVQHIAHGFLPGLVDWLNSVSKLPVKIAQDGERLAEGTVFIAPDAHHLSLSNRNALALNTGAPFGGHRPSVTALFESAARVYGAEALAVILTGMGNDGVEGLAAVHRAGGHVIAQDEQSSVVFGMPGAAIHAGVAHEVLPLGQIAQRLGEVLSALHTTATAQ